MKKMTQYDYILETTPDETDDIRPLDTFTVAASMLREALRLVADVALDDATNGAILLGRMAGMSLSEIGQRNRMSKQAVHKRVMVISRQWPPLADVLTGTAAALDEAIAGNQKIIETRNELDRIRQEATRWMNKPN